MNNSLLTDKHQRILLKKWKPILESSGIKPIKSETTKIAMAQIFENTFKYYKQKGLLTEAGMTQAGVFGMGPGPDGTKGVLKGKGAKPAGADNDFYIPNVIMPILRRIMPDLIANELVAVQPLNGPVGYALAYRPLYGKHGSFDPSENDNNGKEIGYEPTQADFTGAKNALSSFGETTDEYWKAYLGTDVDTNTPHTWLGTGAGLGDVEYADLDTEYPTVTFGLIKRPVEAKTRKLAAHWSPELAEDMQAMHGIDVEREMINTLSFEVGSEIDRQIITEMVKAAITGGSVSEWSPAKADGLDQMGRLATLLTQITIEANQIAIRTRRGNANFVVTTPRVTALLQQLSINKFTSFKSTSTMPTVPDTGVGALTKVGLINDDQQLLIRDAYATSSADYVLMGYKGKQAGDSGIIYCPYIPLQIAKVLQPGTFTPSIGCRTRYGVMSNPWDAKNFYHFMKIGGLTEQYTFSDTNRQFISTPSKIKVDGTDFGNPVFDADKQLTP